MSDSQFSVTFWSGVGTVTGANFLLEGDSFRALVDCGILQGTASSGDENAKAFPYDPKSVDFLFITHAHADHIGRIPKLVKDGFVGTIYSTPATRALSELMLDDAQRIGDMESRKNGTLALYGPEDVAKSFTLWKTIDYHKPTTITKHLSVELKDAGHILGSSMYLFTVSDDLPAKNFEGKNLGGRAKTILFTGDLGNSPSLLLRDTEFVIDADYIVMDSVYGDRNHESKDEREAHFERVVKQAIAQKGVLVIPCFSLERTQDVLYQFNELVEGKKISSVPIFLDSPLAIELTAIYERITSLYNDSVEKDIGAGDDIFNFPRLKATAQSADSKHIISVPNPKIIIAGSGMSSGGRVLHHELEYLPDPNNILLLMGYQAAGTLGRQLEEGAKEVVIYDQKVPVRAHVEMISGYSGHKDSDHLVDWAEHALPRTKTFFIVMGEPKASLFLSQKMRDNLGANTVLPEVGKVYQIGLE
jgi:metallo-beta-lactamase family protein